MMKPLPLPVMSLSNDSMEMIIEDTDTPPDNTSSTTNQENPESQDFLTKSTLNRSRGIGYSARSIGYSARSRKMSTDSANIFSTESQKGYFLSLFSGQNNLPNSFMGNFNMSASRDDRNSFGASRDLMCSSKESMISSISVMNPNNGNGYWNNNSFNYYRSDPVQLKEHVLLQQQQYQQLQAQLQQQQYQQQQAQIQQELHAHVLQQPDMIKSDRNLSPQRTSQTSVTTSSSFLPFGGFRSPTSRVNSFGSSGSNNNSVPSPNTSSGNSTSNNSSGGIASITKSIFSFRNKYSS